MLFRPFQTYFFNNLKKIICQIHISTKKTGLQQLLQPCMKRESLGKTLVNFFPGPWELLLGYCLTELEGHINDHRIALGLVVVGRGPPIKQRDDVDAGTSVERFIQVKTCR